MALKRAFELASQAAFLWASRAFVARSSATTFETLADVDNRLSTLVSLLSRRPGLAERFLQAEHAPLRTGHAFVTAAVALKTGAQGVFEELVTRLGSDAELLQPLASALAWLEYRAVSDYMRPLLASSAPQVIRLGLVTAVAHRVDPGVALDQALDAEDPTLRATALESVGRLGTAELRPRLNEALEDEDVTCRFWAAWSGVRLGEPAGIPILGQAAAQGGPLAKQACDMALRALEPDRAVRAHARLVSTMRDPRLGALAAGIIGDPTLAGWLLEAMDSPALARCAGAAFCLMTGRDLRRDDLDAAGPTPALASERRASDPFRSDEAAKQVGTDEIDDTLGDQIEDDLVWPDTARLREWWNRHRHGFVPGVRYLAGAPIVPAALANVLHTGNQHQREAAALELALLNPSAPLLDVAAPAHHQVGA